MPPPTQKANADPFAEFADAPKADPFAEFADAPIEQPAVTPRRGWIDTAAGAVVNFPSSAARFAGQTAQGLFQLAKDPRSVAQDVSDILTGTYARYLPKEWIERLNLEDTIAKANAVGGMYKNRYGSIEALKNTLATDPAAFLADVSMLTGLGGAMAPGRAGAALATTSRYTDPLRVSGILPVAERLGSFATRTGGVLARGPKTNVLLEATEGRAPEVINALRNQPEIVPGALPTAGEAAAPTGITEYAALQERARRQLPTPYFAREQAQNAARVDAIRQVGGTPLSLETARKVREATAKTNYGAAGAQLVDVDPTFTALLDRPSMNIVLTQAKKLAAEFNKPFSIGRTVPEQRIPGRNLGAGWQGPETVIPAQTAKYPVESMHFVKMAFDEIIKDPPTFGIGKVEARAIANTRGEFLRWLENKASGYRTARTTFAQQSGPINQMEVGQYLESKLTSALQDEAKLRPGVFAGAVEAAPQTIQRATGGARFEKLSDILTPDQIKIVEDVRKDLARQASYETQVQRAGAAGPQAAKAGTEQIKKVVGGVSIPNPLETVVTFANAVLKRFAGKIDRKLAMEIATEMLDPQTAAAALEQAQRRAAQVSATGAAIRGAGRTAGRAATPSAVVTNALATQQNQNALAE